MSRIGRVLRDRGVQRRMGAAALSGVLLALAFPAFDIGRAESPQTAREDIFESIAGGTLAAAIPSRDYCESRAERNGSRITESTKRRQFNLF